MLAQVTPTAEERALMRALTEQTKVKHLHGELWLASSTSRPGTWHVVNARCDCEAGQRGIPCKHMAAVKYARLVSHACEHCGEVSVEVERGTDGRHFCADRVQCWHRWDKAHGF